MKVGSSFSDLLYLLVLVAEKLSKVCGVKAKAYHFHWLILCDAILHLAEEVLHRNSEVIYKVLLSIILLSLRPQFLNLEDINYSQTHEGNKSYSSFEQSISKEMTANFAVLRIDSNLLNYQYPFLD